MDSDENEFDELLGTNAIPDKWEIKLLPPPETPAHLRYVNKQPLTPAQKATQDAFDRAIVRFKTL